MQYLCFNYSELMSNQDQKLQFFYLNYNLIFYLYILDFFQTHRFSKDFADYLYLFFLLIP
jgi:hypothetical protein